MRPRARTAVADAAPLVSPRGYGVEIALHNVPDQTKPYLFHDDNRRRRTRCNAWPRMRDDRGRATPGDSRGSGLAHSLEGAQRRA